MIDPAKWKKLCEFGQPIANTPKIDFPTKCLDSYNFQGRLLDAACGHTILRQYFESRGVEYVGFDMTAYPNVIIGDVHDMPFEGGIFDWVLCSHTLEHCIAPYLVLTELNRVLKHNSNLLLIVPMPEFGDCFEHILVPTLEQTRRLLRRAGFNVIDMKCSEASVFWWAIKEKEICRAIGI